jgi:invasion protein IalB
MVQFKRSAAHIAGACFAATVQLATAGSGYAQERTTTTYDDWVLQCVTPAGAAKQKFCDIAQVTRVKSKNQPFSRVAIRAPQKGQPVRLEVQVPVNVWLLATVRLLIRDGDPGLAAPFQRCVPAGCFAEFELKDDAIAKLRSAKEAGKVMFKDSTGHDVTVPLSFKGFTQAFDVLSKG